MMKSKCNKVIFILIQCLVFLKKIDRNEPPWGENGLGDFFFHMGWSTESWYPSWGHPGHKAGWYQGMEYDGQTGSILGGHDSTVEGRKL